MSETGTRSWRILSAFGGKPYWIEKLAMQILGARYEPFKNLVMGRKDAVCELRLVSAFMRQHLKRGVMIDVGSQYGQSFVPFASAGWEIYAFEPDPHPEKTRAMQSRKTSRVRLSNVALSNKTDEMPFYCSPESTGVSTLNPFLESHEEVAVVATDTLANIVAKEGIEKIDFLKIDTEGHDLFVLQGVDWEQTKPTIVLCEFDDRKTTPLGYSYKDVGELLQQAGYAVYLFEWWPISGYGGEVHFRALDTFPCELQDESGWGNMIAVQPSLAESFDRFLRQQKLPSAAKDTAA